MMEPNKIAELLFNESLIAEHEHKAITTKYSSRLFSIHWEIKTLLYLGVLLASTGIGLIIYLNIDSIGHTVLISTLALVCVGCFYYATKNRAPFSRKETFSNNPLSDYLLLFSCLLFLSLEGYAEYQYSIFGNRFGLATIIPTILFAFLAYRYDHKGILSMAITGLAGWLGISVTPKDAFDFDFGSVSLMLTGTGLGIFLVVIAYLSTAKEFKKNFSFIFFNFGMQLLFISSLSGIFSIEDFGFLWYLLLAGLCILSFLYARREQSFYFLLMAALYGYIGLTTLFVRLIDDTFSSDGALFLGLFYFIGSCAAIVLFFFNYKKLLKK